MKQSKLANGMRYYRQATTQWGNGVSIALVVEAGSSVEKPTEAGYMHLLEHLLVGEHAADKFSTGPGSVVAGSKSGQTRRLSTIYRLQVDTPSESHLQHAVAFLRDSISGESFTQEGLGAAKEEVLAELRIRSSENFFRSDWWFKHLFSGTNLANPLIVKESSIRAATLKQLKQLLQTWYTPQRMSLVVVGDIEDELMAQIVADTLGVLKPPTPGPTGPGEAGHVPSGPKGVPNSTSRIVRPPSRPDQHFHARSSLRHGTRVSLLSQLTGGEPGRVKSLRRTVLAQLIARIIDSRLTDTIAQPASAIFGGYSVLEDQFPAGTLVHNLTGVGASNKLLETASQLLRLRQQLAARPIELQDLEQARGPLMRALDLESRLSELEPYRPKLSDDIASGSTPIAAEARRNLYKEIVSSFTLGEVRKAMREWMTESTLHVFVESDSSESARQVENQLESMAEQTRSKNPVDFKRTPVVESLLESRPKPGGASSLSKIAGTEAWQWGLNNGAKIVYVPKDTSDRLVMTSYSPGGLSRLSASPPVLDMDAVEAMLTAGLGPHSGASFMNWASDHQVHVSPWIADYAEGVRASTTLQEAESLLEALHLLLTNPGSDEASFERGLRWMAYRDARSVEERRLGDVRQQFLDRFGSIGDFTFAFLGSVPLPKLVQWTENYLASVPSSTRDERTQEQIPLPRLPERAKRQEYRPGVHHKALVRLHWWSELNPGPAERALLDGIKEELVGALNQELRGVEGGTYVVFASNTVLTSPFSGFRVDYKFECAAAAASSLELAARRVLESVGEFPSEALSRLRVTFSTERDRLRRGGDALFGALATAMTRGEQIQETLAAYETFANVTPAELRAQVRDLLPTEELRSSIRYYR